MDDSSSKCTILDLSVQMDTADPLDLLLTSRSPLPENDFLDSLGGAESIHFSDEEQLGMSKSIQEIFDLEEEPPNQPMSDADTDEAPLVDVEDRMRRTDRLKGALSTLAQLWWSDSGHMDLVAEKLADGSRDPLEPELAPDNTSVVLLKIAADREFHTDMDDFIALVNSAVGYLQHEKFQKALIEQGALETTLAVLVGSYTRFDSHPSIGVAASPDEDDAKILSRMRSSLNQVLSDVSALPEFKVACPVVSPFAASLRRWLSSAQLQLQVCACIMLGNLARSDEACEQFVHISQVHKPLIAIITNANDSQLLHAALGFLKNLALPAKNKVALGEAGIFNVLPRLWSFDLLQQIQFSSISLSRQLIIGNFENVAKVCQRLSEDPDSPAHMRSNISLLVALFQRTDAEPIKMEIARLITGVCRVWNSYKGLPPEELERMRKKFFLMHPDIGSPLSFMVSQNRWPVVRSEGWFVLALMARYPEGAQCVADLMQDMTVFQPLVEMLTGESIINYTPPQPSAEISAVSPNFSSPSVDFDTQPPKPHAQAAEMARIDRENAMVLVAELIKNRGENMAIMRRMLFEDLLKGGSEIVLSYKAAQPGWGSIPVPEELRTSQKQDVPEIVPQSFNEFS
ncbi:hypothetical protein B7494_g4937 [Chlorociboria aeruginascens]|nr:hypothetical protein B7494_g4937 [Chlorociboria aeruginascens]